MKFVIGRTLTILSWDNPVTAFFRKSKKLRHSLGRPSRSDFVQFELFFQAYRKGEPDLLVKYNELTQHYKEAYGIDIYIINPGVPELKYHQEQLAEDLKNGLIQTEKYISPRIEHEVKLMQGLFFTLIGTISDVVYKDLEIEESVAGLVFGLI